MPRKAGKICKETGLTVHQKKYAEILGTPLMKKTYKELAEELGVNECTLHRWNQDKKVLAYAYEIYMMNMTHNLPKIFDALIDEAKKGNVKAAKLIFEKTEKFFNLDSANEMKNDGNKKVTLRMALELIEEKLEK